MFKSYIYISVYCWVMTRLDPCKKNSLGSRKLSFCTDYVGWLRVEYLMMWFRGRSKFFEVWNFRKLNITRLTSHKMVLSKNIWSLGTLNYQKYQKGATRGHVRCYTVVHVTILVNFEFFADGRDMVVVSTNTGISSICFLHDPTDFGSKLQGGANIKIRCFLYQMVHMYFWGTNAPVFNSTLFTV